MTRQRRLSAPHWLHVRAREQGVWDPTLWDCAGVWDYALGSAVCPDDLCVRFADTAWWEGAATCGFRPVLVP